MRPTRERIVQTAALLFRERGYAATGLNRIVDESGGPRGSIYHYFPGGKQELAAEAVAYGGRWMSDVIEKALARSRTAGEAVESIARSMARNLERSRFRHGCPIATTALEEAAESDLIHRAVQTSFRAWQDRLATRLVDDGYEANEADELALFAVASLEGALVVARGLRDAGPVLVAGTRLKELVDAEGSLS